MLRAQGVFVIALLGVPLIRCSSSATVVQTSCDEPMDSACRDGSSCCPSSCAPLEYWVPCCCGACDGVGPGCPWADTTCCLPFHCDGFNGSFVASGSNPSQMTSFIFDETGTLVAKVSNGHCYAGDLSAARAWMSCAPQSPQRCPLRSTGGACTCTPPSPSGGSSSGGPGAVFRMGNDGAPNSSTALDASADASQVSDAFSDVPMASDAPVDVLPDTPIDVVSQ